MGQDWNLFWVLKGERADKPRSIRTAEGIGDRLRAVAFAEMQARDAFRWACEAFPDAPEGLRRAWDSLAAAEDRHLSWLLGRMSEIGCLARERPVSDLLWRSLASGSAREFSLLMASAEERGRLAGERFHELLLRSDPITAALFAKIAEEERAHIALARRYFGGV